MKYVWLRTTPLQVHEAKYLPPTKVTYSYTGFHNDQASYFKHEGTCIVEPGHMHYCSEHTKVTCHLQHLSLNLYED